MWEPLLRGKFGDLYEEVAAVWFWNKLKLRGGSRGKGGAEQLAYYRGGFAALADTLADAIEAQGGEIRREAPATGLRVAERIVRGVETPDGVVKADAVIATPALPIVADLVRAHDPDYAEHLRRIRYLANVCVVLELDGSLSDTYWLSVNDPTFPFVAVIEHTNFEPRRAMPAVISCICRAICRRRILSTRWRRTKPQRLRFAICAACFRRWQATTCAPPTSGERAMPSRWSSAATGVSSLPCERPSTTST